MGTASAAVMEPVNASPIILVTNVKPVHDVNSARHVAMRNVCYALTRRNILMVTIAPTYVRSTAEMLRLNLSKSLSIPIPALPMTKRVVKLRTW